MDTHTVSEWIKTCQEGDFSDNLLRDTLLFARAHSKKSVGLGEDKKTKFPAKPPSADMLSLAKHLETGFAIQCGNFWEVFLTTSSYVTGIRQNNTPLDKDEEKAKALAKNSAIRSAKRAEKQVRRLVNTNKLQYMWTLTFAPPSPENEKVYRCMPLDLQKEPNAIKSVWRMLYLDMQEFYPDMKWLVVYELHDSQKTSDLKRGTWHIHFATNVFLDYEVVNNLWGWGRIQVDDFSKPKKGSRDTAVRNPGAYMSKYIGKNFTKENKHVKRYSRSRNMQVPKKIDLATFFATFPGLQNLEMVYHTTKEIEDEGIKYYNQNITYRECAR